VAAPHLDVLGEPARVLEASLGADAFSTEPKFGVVDASRESIDSTSPCKHDGLDLMAGSSRSSGRTASGVAFVSFGTPTLFRSSRKRVNH